jgi:quinol-cytochrome oxidoreductase complex cytochrome b subunit
MAREVVIISTLYLIIIPYSPDLRYTGSWLTLPDPSPPGSIFALHIYLYPALLFIAGVLIIVYIRVVRSGPPTSHSRHAAVSRGFKSNGLLNI